MFCPHCQQEHPVTAQVCPNTGLSLRQQVLCTNCGQPARPGTRYCAHCGQPLPQPYPHTPVMPPAEIQPTQPPESQRWTRPSVSLVELSRRETRRLRPINLTLQRAKEHWRRQSRIWHLIGYTLLALVLLAGAAGLYLLWGQLRP